MRCTTIFREGSHRWLAFGQDPARPDNVIDTVQYAVCNGSSVMLLDPGGMEVFPTMIAALTAELPIEQVGHIFVSHQDPDVSSALPLWRQVCRRDVEVHVPWMWTGFVSHFDRQGTVTTIPDDGREISLGGLRLRMLPAHYLHSPGNYNLYDPKARVLFSGDVGAALLPAPVESMFVEDFAEHVRYMDAFHRRWMGSPAARDAWVATVSGMEIDVLAPQHGLLFRGDDVRRFIDWFAGLEIGSGLGVMRAG